jgi:tRNA (guanine37-N1)-methyltransferase
MVLKADVLAAAIDHAQGTAAGLPGAGDDAARRADLAGADSRAGGGAGCTILCGRFEGFDERIFEGREVEKSASPTSSCRAESPPRWPFSTLAFACFPA